MMPTTLGCRSPLRPPARVLGSYQPPAQMVEVSHHLHLSPRVENQGEKPSCVGQAFGNAIEIVRSLIGLPRVEIDGEAIWRKGRDVYDGGDYSDGLTLAQGYYAARLLGIIPNGVLMRRVNLSAEAVCKAMQAGPLVAANTVHSGWDNLHPDNQAVDESQPFTLGANGHATCIFAFDLHGWHWMTRHENSWGEKGFVAMTIEHFLATALDEPILLYRGKV